MADLAELKIVAVDQATATLALIKGKAEELTKSGEGIQKVWNGGLMDGFTKGPALAVVGSIGAIVAAVGAAGAYFYGLTKSVMEAQAGLKQMAEVTGASVEGLSAIRSVAKLTGIEMESVAGGLTKMAKNIEVGGATTENALKSIGLSLKDLRGLKTDEQFLKVTQAMNGYADGAGKTAAAQLILGKSGAQLLPLMKDIAEAGDLVTKTTTAQARQADELEKNIKRLTLAKEAWKKVVGTELVPVLDDVVKVLLKIQTETNGTLSTTKELAADGSIKRWAQDALLAGAAAIDFAIRWVGAIKLIGEGVAVFGASMVSVQADVIAKLTSLTPFLRGETAKMAAAAQENADKMKASFSKSFDGLVNRDSDKYFNLLKGQFDESARAAAAASAHFAKFGDTMKGIKPVVTGLKEETAKATNEFDKLAKALADLALKRIQIAFEIDADSAKVKLAEIESLYKRFGGESLARAINVAQNVALDAFAANAKTKLDQIKAEIAKFAATAAAAGIPAERIKALLNEIAEKSHLLDIEKEIASVAGKREEIARAAADREREAMVALSTGLEAIRNGTDDYVNALTEAGMARDLELSLIGLSKQEQDRLNVAAKAETTIRALNLELWRLQIAATYEMTENQREINALAQTGVQLKIDAVNAEKDALPIYLENKRAKESELEVWKSISDTATNFFSDLFQNGKSAFGNLWKTIKKFFADLAAQFAVKYLLNIGTSGSGGVAGSMLSAIMGGGGGGGDGIGGGGEGSMLGAAASVLGVGSFVSGILGTAGLGAAGTALSASLAATGSATAALTAAGTSLVASGGLLGSAASVLMAIPVWGWIALAVIAAVAYFGGDETGIKIDNNTNGVGNPASHFTKNPLADYDVSGDLPASAFQPLIDAVNKYDQILVDALLSPEQTAAIRARLGSVINPDWIGFDDEASAKTAIGKASKEFLQTRYGAVFDEVDAKIAATVRGFAGGSEELLKYVGEVIAVMQLLKTNAADFAHLIGGTLSIADLSAVQAEGESLLQTLNRVVTVFGATNAVAFLMGKDVTTAFGAVGMSSLAARQDLIALAGGISNLSAMTDAYYKNFYSAEERAALELKSKTALITQTFKDLKLDIPESDAEFRKLIESLDLSTESGRATFVALMKINGIFHELHTTVDGVTEAVIAVLAPLTTLYGIMLEAANYSTNMGPGRDSGTRTNGDKNPMRVREDARVVAMALQDALPTALQGYLTGGGGGSTAQNAPTYAIKDRELIDARRNMESALAMSTRLMSEQANGALAAFNRQRNSLQDLMTMSNRSAGALASVVGGMQSMRDATAQLLLQIQQIKAQVGEMFGSTIRDLKLSTMTEQEKYDYYQKDAEEARQLSLKSTDPLEIARLAARVNADVIAAQGLLTPEQRARTNPEQIANLETYNKQVQDWLDVQAKATTKTFDDFMEKLGKKFDAILATEDDISKRNSDSADKQLVAATTPRRFIVDFFANVPGDVETTEVGG